MPSLPAALANRSDGRIEALLHDGLAAAELGVLVAQRRVVAIGVAGLALGFVQVDGEVLRDEP